MNHWNAVVNRRAVALLDVQPGDTVLEVGFGGGDTLELLLTAGSTVRVVGLECSVAMVTSAHDRFTAQVAEGRLALEHGDAAALPCSDDSVDRIVTVNVLYFWEDLPAVLGEFRRVLRPEGIMVLAYRPASTMQRLAFTRQHFRLPEDEALLDAVHAAGFETLALEQGKDGSMGYRCLVASCLERHAEIM